MALILPARFNQQPQGAATLTGEYANNSALCFLPNSLHVRNLAKSNPGKVLTRVSPTLKTALGGVGVGCSNTTRAYLDSDWVNPIQSSASDGTGAFSLLFSATLASAATRSTPFHIRLNSGAFNTVFIVQNGGRDEGVDTSYNESGTLWMGTFEGVTNHARGLKVTSAFGATPTSITALFNRNSDGTTNLWLNGVQVASNAVGYQTAIATGTAQMLALGGFASADGFASPDPIHLIYSANRSFSAAESARLSRNPWQIFQAPDSRIWASVASESVDLSADAGSYSLTGQAASFAIEQLSGSGSYAITGQSASFDIEINAAAGSYALTGSDADLVATGVESVTLDAAAGSYAVAGASAAFDLKQATGAGSYSQTGAAASFDLGMAVYAGSYEITGADANLLAQVDVTLLAESGSYSITGADADLLVSAQSGSGGGGYLYQLENERFVQRLKKAAEDSAQLQEDAEQVVAQANSVDSPVNARQIQQDAAQVSSDLQAAIAELTAIGDYYQQTGIDTQQRQELQTLLIEAQIQAELAQQKLAQQIEELDIVFITMALLAI